MSRMFDNSRVEKITGGSFTTRTENHFHGFRGMDGLKGAAVPGAFHNSLERRDPPKCHKHTREAILQKIMDWVMKKIDTNAFMMWLYGAAGAGKSAIAQTIAELCDEQKFLLASFFFFRSDPLRSNSKRLVATIAYQVAVVVPGVRRLMEAVIERDPHIFSRSIITQFTALIVDPLEHLVEHTALPNLIIIDGLDECMDGTQVEILDMIFDIGKRSKFPFLFLVASRPEQQISTTLGNGRLREGLTRLPLETDYTSLNDIKRFLQDKFDDIRQTHPIRSDLPSSWPSRKDIQTLSDKSSGQFVYASTVVKFVSSPRHKPTDRLEIILGLRPTGKDLPFAELDALYKHVLSSVEDAAKATEIIAVTLTLRGVDDDARGNIVARILYLAPGDIKLCLLDLGSLVEYMEDRWSPRLNILHATLGDFLFDQTRSHELYIDLQSIHTMIVQVSLRRMKLSARDSLPQNLLADCDCQNYSFKNLKYHCSKAELAPDIVAEIRYFSVRQVLSQSWNFAFAACLADFADFIPSLGIEGSDLISTRYLSEHDDGLISILNSCQPFMIHALIVLHSSGALVVHPFLCCINVEICLMILALHGHIFHVICNDIQNRNLLAFTSHLLSNSNGNNKNPGTTALFDFFSNPQRSRHHALAVDNRMHNSVTEHCFSYILNLQSAHFPGVHQWASRSKIRPWLWRRRKMKSVISKNQFKWRLKQHSLKWNDYTRPDKEHGPFWALFLAIRYLPYLLDKASKSAPLIAWAEMWPSNLYPLSLFPRNTNKAERAVERYLQRCGGSSGMYNTSRGQKRLACTPGTLPPNPYPQFQHYHPQDRTPSPILPSTSNVTQALASHTSLSGVFAAAPEPREMQNAHSEQTHSYNHPTAHMLYPSISMQPSQAPPSFPHSGCQPSSWTPSLYPVGADTWALNLTPPLLFPHHLPTGYGICADAKYPDHSGSSLAWHAGSFATDRPDSEGGIWHGSGGEFGWNWEGGSGIGSELLRPIASDVTGWHWEDWRSVGSDLLPGVSDVTMWHGEDGGGIGSALLPANVSRTTEWLWEDRNGISSNLRRPDNPLKRKFGESDDRKAR